MPTKLAEITSSLKTALKADAKKTAMLGVLAAVLIVLMGRAVLNGARPAGAMAAIVQVGKRLSTDARPITTPQTDRVAAAYTKWCREPAKDLGRNVFVTRLEFFPADNANAAAEAGDGDFWNQLGKSLSQATDEENKRENLKESFRQQAAKLKLQSTMPGAQPRAILDGQLVNEGSVVEGFHVLKIEARRVVVEREGVRLEIAMK